MAIISAGFVARTRQRGVSKTLRQAVNTLLVRPLVDWFHLFRTRSAPDYRGPSEAELVEIEQRLQSIGVPVQSLVIPTTALAEFKKGYPFPENYHGGVQAGVYDEKLLEHFIAYHLCGLEDFGEGDVYVDVAAGGSPWARILRNANKVSYAVDLRIKPDYRELSYYLRMDATQTSFEDESVNAMSLQCAYEMFAGQDDIRFLSESRRLLKPGGTVVIAPLYMHTEHCGYSSPEYWHKGYADSGATEYVWRNMRGIPFSRKYSPELLQERVLDRISALGMEYELYRIDNKKELGRSIYCHFVLVVRRPRA